jgi:amidohydrolase
VTKINTGAGPDNAIPDEANMYVDVRCIENNEMETILEKLRIAIESTAKANGANVEYTIDLCPAAEYTDELIETNSEAIKETLGEKGLIKNLYTAGSEDFHFYAKRLGCKAGYLGLGSDLTPGLHHKDMKFNREAMYYGVDILIKVICKRLM